MGEYTVFECRDCGYRSEKIRWGVGSNDPRRRFLAAHCPSCAIFTEVDLTGRDILVERFCCSRCGSAVTFTEHVETYECPRCNSSNMLLHQEGYW